MKNFTIVLTYIISSILIFTGCKKDENNDVERESIFIPLKVGNYWNYSGKNGTEEITGTENYNGNIWYVVNNDDKSYLETEDGFYHRYGDYIFQLLKYPVQVGQTWEVPEGEEMHYFNVESIEDATANNILYEDCYLIIEDFTEGGISKIWYKKGIGVVKDEGGEFGELLSYKID